MIPKFCPTCSTRDKKKFRATEEGNDFRAACSQCGYVHKPKGKEND